jgi:uncharacterized OB-fold protein
MYCVTCFERIGTFRDVGLPGRVTALTESYVDFDGTPRVKPLTLAFITFRGVTGGIIHRVSGRGLKTGSAVEPKYRPKTKRTGSLTDIEEFRLVKR